MPHEFKVGSRWLVRSPIQYDHKILVDQIVTVVRAALPTSIGDSHLIAELSNGRRIYIAKHRLYPLSRLAEIISASKV